MKLRLEFHFANENHSTICYPKIFAKALKSDFIVESDKIIYKHYKNVTDANNSKFISELFPFVRILFKKS